MAPGDVNPAVMKTAQNSFEPEPAHQPTRTISGVVGYVVVIAAGLLAVTYPVVVAAVGVGAAIVVRVRRRGVPDIRSVATRPRPRPERSDAVPNSDGRTTGT